MKYIIMFNRGCIMTDNYNQSEIRANTHIKHIKEDMRVCGIKSATVFDENDNFVCRLRR